MSKKIFYNSNRELWFGKTLLFMLFRRPWKPKNAWLTRALSESDCFYILPRHDLTGFNLIVERLHIFLWAALNKYNPFRVKMIKNTNIAADDYLFIQYIGNYTSFENDLETKTLTAYLNEISCKKYIFINHFPYRIKAGFNALQKLAFDGFIAEVNLWHTSPFFAEFAPVQFSEKDFKVVNFVVEQRFFDAFEAVGSQVRTPKILATGSVSLSMKDDNDFTSFFNDDQLQPLRYQIASGENLNGKIASIVTHINEGGAPKSFWKTRSLLGKIRALYHNAYVYGQRSYHSIDLPTEYSRYRFHFVGEEIVGLPGIGAFEGMAAGSILLGDNSTNIYSSIGLVSQKHYLPFSGTLSSMNDAYNEAEKVFSDADFEILSSAAHEFAYDHFSTTSVFQKFMKDFS